ncbi:IS66 family insertion sequence hypothetical protein [Oleomonas cavernae]|uniref:Transposase n=1 Tax=Oleomonas cavernae TaxID=2320859 RepID=A0A418W8X6_9PROT|nr:transposase [Oleomonas cavernae]RJF86465.1 IS66 family insertion sequence hypothetical protein [Oleomonas cavernae]
MSQMTVMTGPERRRRWSVDEREQILAAAFAPGAVVSAVARRFEISTGLIYKWRRETAAPEPAIGFVPAVLMQPVAEAAVDPARPAPAIVVEMAGICIRIEACAPAELVTATLRALR